MENGELSWRDRGRLWLRLGIRLVLVVVLILALCFLAPPLFSLFMPFVVAFIVALLLNPVLKALQKWFKLPRGFLSLLLILLVFAAAGGILTSLGFSIFNEIRSLAENWQSIWAGAQATIIAVSEFLDRILGYLPTEAVDSVNTALIQFTAWLQEVIPLLLADFASRAGNFAMSIPSFAVASVIFVMASYFIMADFPRIRFLISEKMTPGAKEFFDHVRRTAVGAFGGYVRAQVIISIGVFFILLVGFLLIRQNYSVLLALVLAVLDFIPIIGSGTIMVPWAIIDLFSGNWVHAVGLMAVWGVISVFRRVAEPKVVGSQTGLSPILSLASIYVGMKLGGVLGMILGPILCLVVINVCKTGLFDSTLADLRMAVDDTSAFLRGGSGPPGK